MNPKKLTKHQFYKIVGQRIMKARFQKGWSRQTLENKTGVNRATIYNWEMGTRGIQLYHFALVCAALDLSVEEVLRGHNAKSMDS